MNRLLAPRDARWLLLVVLAVAVLVLQYLRQPAQPVGAVRELGGERRPPRVVEIVADCEQRIRQAVEECREWGGDPMRGDEPSSSVPQALWHHIHPRNHPRGSVCQPDGRDIAVIRDRRVRSGGIAIDDPGFRWSFSGVDGH